MINQYVPLEARHLLSLNMREDDALQEALIDLDFALFEHAKRLTFPLEEKSSGPFKKGQDTTTTVNGGETSNDDMDQQHLH